PNAPRLPGIGVRSRRRRRIFEVMTRCRCAVRPRCILSPLLVVALIAAMSAAAFWQLGRHEEKRDRNAGISTRTSESVAPVGELLENPDADTTDLEYRGVSAEGSYLDSDILVRSRSLEGSPGSWVVTPLQTDDGT